MARPLVQLVTLLLLLVQGVVAVAPGQVLCIHIRDCGEHHHRSEHHHRGETGPDRHAPEVEHSGGCHDHRPLSGASVATDDCDCHLHVPVPSDERIPTAPRADQPDLRAALVPMIAMLVMSWDRDPARTLAWRGRPPDFAASDQVLGLRATRLII